MPGSDFSRRSTNGPVMRRSCWVAAWSASRSIGTANRSRNSRDDPSSPGETTCMIDQSSDNLFSTGVPVSATRRPARSRRTAWAWAVPEFLTCCASSRTSRPHSIPLSTSMSRATSE